jgi:CBS domain-containing protein
MYVRNILKSKKNIRVDTVRNYVLVSDAVHKLHELRIGALVVVDDAQKIMGIISERDIVRGLADQGVSILSQEVSSLMTRDVLVCSVHDSLADLMKIMTDKKIRHLPVIDNQEMIGIITIGDLVKAQLTQAAMEVENLKNYVTG